MDKSNRENPLEIRASGNSKRLSKIRYNPEPDFTKPLLEISHETRERLFSRLSFLYGKTEAEKWLPELERILKAHHAHKSRELVEMEKEVDPKERFTEKDMVLITYGDMIHGEGKTPLAVLHNFVRTFNRGAINTLHILPFFPYSSDRGFAIVDFRMVDPNLGTWDDILNMADEYNLMFDGVLNHCSSKSRMFREFLRGNPRFKHFFISYNSPDELTADQRSKIFRPRTSDILTKFHTVDGPRYVWTTFSEDQIDINFRNPDALMTVIEGLLFYVRRGADMLRLDAVTYIWAEPGTECVHLPETHEIVKLLRDVLEAVAPGVALVTETNVPHEDNVSYFGNGYDEAHMVYNFALPPLVLHTFYTGNATAVSEWTRDLRIESDSATFFNILDTHDGIGLMGVRNILPKKDIDFIIQKAKENGALISYKMTEDFSEEPYEINSTWWSAINKDDNGEDVLLQVKRYVASRSIAFAIQGVPGIYAHGVAGTSNDYELFNRTKHNRDVNRGVIDVPTLSEALNGSHSKLSLIRHYGSKLALARTTRRAFHPQGDQRVLMISPNVFAVLRTSPENDQRILALTNVTARPCNVVISLSELGMDETRWRDVLSEKEWQADKGKLSLNLEPYDVAWLKPSDR